MTSLNGLPSLPFYTGGTGVSTPYGTLIAPGSKIAAYVRGTNGTLLNISYDDPFIVKNQVATLAEAVSKVRSGAGDTIVVLPGHTENFAVADPLPNLLAGTKIVGVGEGELIPTFRWTATAATVLLDVASVRLSGLRLRMEGANGVVAPITVSAAGCSITDCDIEVASGASNKATTAITVATGADRFSFVNNRVRGSATHNVTNGISVTGAVESLLIQDCLMTFSATAANGLINVSAAATNMVMRRLHLYNTHTSSTATIALGDVACDGHFTEIYSAMKNDGTATAQGITFGTAALVQCNQCYVVDARAASGIISPGVET